MTIEQYQNNLRAAVRDLQNSRLSLMNTLAADTLDTVQNRVQQKGVNGNSNSFDTYSPGYLKWRKENGLQTDYKDFTATGRMWQNTNIKVVKNTPSQTIVEIAPNSPFEIKKMQWNSARESVNLLKLTKQEETELRQDYQKGILKILKNNNVI